MGRSVVRDRHRHGAGQGALGDRCAGFMVRRREWQHRLVAAGLHRAAALGVGAVGGDGVTGCRAVQQPKGRAA